MQRERAALDNWKHQNVYVQEIDIGHQCTLVRWLLSRNIIEEISVIKASFCARGFNKLQDFPTDSPYCLRIG